jgi:hypothetical protein
VTQRQVPLSRPYVDEREEELVLKVLRSGRLSLGPMVDRFEAAFAERVGAGFAAAVSSGTAGLHLCARLAGLRPGDEAVTSPFSFVASANAVMYEGATPVFADVDPRTLNLDPAAVEAAITPRTRAIVAVDIFGYPCELDPLRVLADRGHRDEPLPPFDPPPALHARAVRLPGGHVPGVRGREPPDDGAALLHRPRARGSGTGRRRAPTRRRPLTR